MKKENKITIEILYILGRKQVRILYIVICRGAWQQKYILPERNAGKCTNKINK